jgi:hypothetical protein
MVLHRDPIKLIKIWKVFISKILVIYPLRVTVKGCELLIIVIAYAKIAKF